MRENEVHILTVVLEYAWECPKAGIVGHYLIHLNQMPVNFEQTDSFVLDCHLQACYNIFVSCVFNYATNEWH